MPKLRFSPGRMRVSPGRLRRSQTAQRPVVARRNAHAAAELAGSEVRIAPTHLYAITAIGASDTRRSAATRSVRNIVRYAMDDFPNASTNTRPICDMDRCTSLARPVRSNGASVLHVAAQLRYALIGAMARTVDDAVSRPGCGTLLALLRCATRALRILGAFARRSIQSFEGTN
jgi:hypothetical protein